MQCGKFFTQLKAGFLKQSWNIVLRFVSVSINQNSSIELR